MWLTAHGSYHAAFILSTRMTRKARIVFVMMPKPVNYKSASSVPKKLPENCDLLTFMIPDPLAGTLGRRSRLPRRVAEALQTMTFFGHSDRMSLQGLFLTQSSSFAYVQIHLQNSMKSSKLRRVAVSPANSNCKVCSAVLLRGNI